MPRKRSYRKRKPFTWIPVNAQISLGALADDTVLKGTISTLTEDFYIAGAKGIWTMREHTAAEGPITVGFGHSDYSVAEIEEKLDAGGSFTGPAAKIEGEQARRLVRIAGMFTGLSTDEVLGDGLPANTKLNFVIQDGKGLDIWAYNQSGGPLTSGTVVRFTGHVYGRWLY